MVRRRYVVEALEGRVLNSATTMDSGVLSEMDGRNDSATVAGANVQAEIIGLDGGTVTIDENKGEMDDGDD